MNSRTRKMMAGLLSSIEERVQWWLKQEEDQPRDLGIESQLQQLDAIGIEDVESICIEIEGHILSGGEMLYQLAATAYDSLVAVGYDCRGFDWAI